uniref:Uncharacterized protein n=1 Tax=Pipistrellus kuhlii TaxID=59472 RepID=A0A7J7TA69_PIPKU|nr:hypothetical protein mPipKuh1_009676 [Pipistrellus kuhlii]
MNSKRKALLIPVTPPPVFSRWETALCGGCFLFLPSGASPPSRQDALWLLVSFFLFFFLSFFNDYILRHIKDSSEGGRGGRGPAALPPRFAPRGGGTILSGPERLRAARQGAFPNPGPGAVPGQKQKGRHPHPRASELSSLRRSRPAVALDTVYPNGSSWVAFPPLCM